MNAEAIEHFRRLGRALAETHVAEGPPRDFQELIERMRAIDPASGMGTTDPLGGDWDSHVSYLRNRRVLKDRKERCGPAR